LRNSTSLISNHYVRLRQPPWMTS